MALKKIEEKPFKEFERAVGDSFTLQGKEYTVVEKIGNCEGCAFINSDCWRLEYATVLGSCAYPYRYKYKNNVIFVEKRIP